MNSDSSTKKAIASALRYLGVRSRSRKEISDYLDQKNYSEIDKNNALEYLDAQGLIDESAFTTQWTRMRLSQGKGDRLIRFELIKKGITKDLIDKVFFNTPDEDWFSAIAKTLSKKRISNIGRGFVEQQEARKVLFQKGFSKHYIDAFLQNEVQ